VHSDFVGDDVEFIGAEVSEADFVRLVARLGLERRPDATSHTFLAPPWWSEARAGEELWSATRGPDCWAEARWDGHTVLASRGCVW
jgi:hypothetical protein